MTLFRSSDGFIFCSNALGYTQFLNFQDTSDHRASGSRDERTGSRSKLEIDCDLAEATDKASAYPQKSGVKRTTHVMVGNG